MKRMNLLFAALMAAALMAAVPHASAQTGCTSNPCVHYIGAGSSAMFQGFEVAAVNDLAQAIVTANPTFTVHHWSVKTGSHSPNNGCGATCVAGDDNRASGGTTPPLEYGNFWVVWVCSVSTSPCPAGNVTDIWAYLSVDSTVGNRLFLAQPSTTQHGALLQLNTTAGGGVAATSPDNAASPGILDFGAPGNGASATCPSGFSSNCDDAALDNEVIIALGGSTGTPIIDGMTDIRPEDAKYATNRSLGSPVDTSSTCGAPPCRSWALGYGPGPIGTGIQSSISTAKATPVQFGLPGYTDPITSIAVPTTIKVIPVGESPIIFVANRSNTANGLGQACAGACGAAPWAASYWASNLWDQHPYPPNGLPPAPVTRRPLGNMFTGHDCGVDNAVFQPTDTGNRGVTAPVVNAPITLWLREPLSGTMNTTEFSEFRIYGTTNGNGAPGNGQPALTSQEQNVVPPGDNPLKNKACVTFGGVRSRGVGTGEVLTGSSGAGGVLNTPDSMAYAFFSFSNVSKLAGSAKYGYLTIDGVDPLFDNYSNTAGDAGQPAVNGTPTSWGELPLCNEATGIPVKCRANAVWTHADAICSGNTGCSFPHLRDGTYPAWSELRLLCDTNNAHCLATSDIYGGEALVENLQSDIHNSNFGGVPDLLPFSEAAAGALSFNPPFGDVGFVREHYAYQLSTGNPNTAPTSTHQSAPKVSFGSEPCGGGGAGTPVTGPTPSAECGGDAGGLIKPAGSTGTGVLQ
jgi:hypothetical protein